MSPTFDIQQVAVIGAGTMGRGIVISLASAGLPVLWLESNAPTLDAGLAMIEQTWLQQVGKQRLTQVEADANLKRVRPVQSYARWRRRIWSSRRYMKAWKSSKKSSVHWMRTSSLRPFWPATHRHWTLTPSQLSRGVRSRYWVYIFSARPTS